jgi:hypothetical protein
VLIPFTPLFGLQTYLIPSLRRTSLLFELLFELLFVTQEFEGSNWEEQVGQGEENQLFQDDWEDDNTEDDFTQQLRAQIDAAPAPTNP